MASLERDDTAYGSRLSPGRPVEMFSLRVTSAGGCRRGRHLRGWLPAGLSSFFPAPKMMILAPGFNSDLSPATKVTIGVSGGTTTFFSPSLYFTRMFWPSVPLTVSATVALVMVELGRRSQGLKPSAAPRWVSGKI